MTRAALVALAVAVLALSAPRALAGDPPAAVLPVALHGAVSGHVAPVPAAVLRHIGTPRRWAVPECARRALSATLVALPRDHTLRYAWADLSAHHAAGLTYTTPRVIALDPATPCWAVRAVIHHEWAHAATARHYGTYGAAELIHSGGRAELELLADCVGDVLTRRAGALRYTPYLGDGHACPSALHTARDAILSGA